MAETTPGWAFGRVPVRRIRAERRRDGVERKSCDFDGEYRGQASLR